MKIITFASAKGGVTKTTSAVNVAAWLGQHKATLVIDFDSQGQAALWFGKDPQSGVFDWLTANKRLENVTVAARETGQLWLLPGDSRTKFIEMQYGRPKKEQFLGFVAMIKGLEPYFEYVVIDTAPAGVLQQIAMAAADEIVVPFRAERQGVVGAINTRDMIQDIQPSANVTFMAADYYRVVVEHQRSLSEIRGIVGVEAMAPLPVPHRIAVAEAVAVGQTIWEYDGDGLEEVREAYRQLSNKIAEPFC